MKVLIVIALIIAGLYHFQPQWFDGLLKGKGAFDNSGKPQMIVFTYDGCGQPCDDAVAMAKRTQQDYYHLVVSPGSSEEVKMKDYGLSTRSFPGIVVGREKFNGYYPHKLKPVLIDHFGMDVLSGPERRAMKKHFNADGSPKLVFYGTSWCGYCKKLRQHLTANNTPYIEWDVEKNSAAMARFKTLGGRGYPFAFIGHHQIDGGRLGEVDKSIAQLL